MSLDRREFLLALAAASALPAAAKAAPWRAGFATVDITPPLGVWMGGYAARKEPAQGIAQPLHARRWPWRIRPGTARDGRTIAAERAPLHVLRLGSLSLVALSGEVVVDYALAIKRKYGSGTWVAGYTDSVFGYVPSARVLREGGYEGGEAMLYFGRPGPFADTVETTMLKGVDALMAAAGVRPAEGS